MSDECDARELFVASPGEAALALGAINSALLNMAVAGCSREFACNLLCFMAGSFAASAAELERRRAALERGHQASAAAPRAEPEFPRPDSRIEAMFAKRGAAR